MHISTIVDVALSILMIVGCINAMRVATTLSKGLPANIMANVLKLSLKQLVKFGWNTKYHAGSVYYLGFILLALGFHLYLVLISTVGLMAVMTGYYTYLYRKLSAPHNQATFAA